MTGKLATKLAGVELASRPGHMIGRRPGEYCLRRD